MPRTRVNGLTTNRTGMMRSRVRAIQPNRYSGQQANPVGNTRVITRETAPMHPNAGPRTQHPKLNTKPWSTSFAQKRKAEPKRASKHQRKG